MTSLACSHSSHRSPACSRSPCILPHAHLHHLKANLLHHQALRYWKPLGQSRPRQSGPCHSRSHIRHSRNSRHSRNRASSWAWPLPSSWGSCPPSSSPSWGSSSWPSSGSWECPYHPCHLHCPHLAATLLAAGTSQTTSPHSHPPRAHVRNCPRLHFDVLCRGGCLHFLLNLLLPCNDCLYEGSKSPNGHELSPLSTAARPALTSSYSVPRIGPWAYQLTLAAPSPWLPVPLPFPHGPRLHTRCPRAAERRPTSTALGYGRHE